jgi:hypothetical protein
MTARTVARTGRFRGAFERLGELSGERGGVGGVELGEVVRASEGGVFMLIVFLILFCNEAIKQLTSSKD